MKKKIIAFISVLLIVFSAAFVTANASIEYNNTAYTQNNVVSLDTADAQKTTSSHLIDTYTSKDASEYNPLISQEEGEKRAKGEPATQSACEIDLYGDDCNLAEPGWNVRHPINSIQNWFVEIVMVLLRFFGAGEAGLIATDGAGNFTNTGLKQFQQFFNALSWGMCAIGILFAVTETAIAYENGSGNALMTIKNVVLAIFWCSCFTFISSEMFYKLIGLTVSISTAGLAGGASYAPSVRSIMGSSLATVTVGSMIAAYIVAEFSNPVGIILLVFKLLSILLLVVKYYVTLCKRLPVFLCLLAKSSLVPFSIARGSGGQQAEGTISEMLRFFMGVAIQVWMFHFGLTLILGTHFILGFAFCTASDEVFSFLGAPGPRGFDLIHDMHDVLHISDDFERPLSNALQNTSGGSAGSSAAAAAGK